MTIRDLLESELDAICCDPRQTHDLRLDAHLELRRRANTGRPLDIVGRLGHSENLPAVVEAEQPE